MNTDLIRNWIKIRFLHMHVGVKVPIFKENSIGKEWDLRNRKGTEKFEPKTSNFLGLNFIYQLYILNDELSYILYHLI